VFEHDAYADRAFHAEAAGLDGRDRSFAMALAYGTVQRRATLDHVAQRLINRPLAKLDPPVLAALRL
jgi:16S rRNA (cytosine967-C5)-methyltransferase